jgi:hypothetical protein
LQAIIFCYRRAECGILYFVTKLRSAHAFHPSSSALPEGLVGQRVRSQRLDPSRNRPRRWSQRHELVLRMHLGGWRTSEIAAELRYSPHRVSMILNSPLFQERKAALLRELAGDDRAQLLDAIRREAVPNVQFLCAVRDDETLPTAVRLRAAQAIATAIDRVVPR